ncbi:MAG TPA: hypothetical protein VIJ38_02105 [Acidobacteriaceae bacterium]
MALVTLDGVGQSSSAIAGQSTTYIVSKILTRSPAIPDSLVNSELQDTLRHFYTMSTGWRDTVGPYNVGQGVGSQSNPVQLNPVDQYKQVQFVLNAWLYPNLPGSNSPQALIPSARLLIGSDVGPPSRFFMMRPDLMQLYAVPDKNYGAILYAYAVLLPVVNTTKLPNIAITQHLDALMWGTMERLYRMKGKPWSDPVAAGDYHQMYNKEILLARDQANRAYSGVNTPAQFPPFAPRRYGGYPPAVAG